MKLLENILWKVKLFLFCAKYDAASFLLQQRLKADEKKRDRASKKLADLKATRA